MKRVKSPARPNWRARVEEVGLDYHADGKPPSPETDHLVNWDESEHWELTSAEVDALDDATQELHDMCLGVVDHVVRNERHLLTTSFGMSDWMADYAARSWLRSDPSLMGRMDLAVNPANGDIKMLEYNADTPTLAIETAMAQWGWMQDLHPEADQFNSLHEKILEGFQELAKLTGGAGMHFMAYKAAGEEWAHSTYFRDLAQQAGIPTHGLDIADLRWDDASGRFLDELGRPIRFLHKLYAWEWCATDEFGPFLARDTMGIIEPPWKAIISHKAILPLLWRAHEGHRLLLETHFGAAPATGEWVEKAMLGREGANVRFMKDGVAGETTAGTYGDSGIVSQRRAVLPVSDGWTTIIGSWIANGKSAGVVFREGRSDVVRGDGRVVPHWFR